MIPAHFPRIEHVIEPQEVPAHAKRIGEEVTEQYHYSAAVLKVDRYVRTKYAVDDPACPAGRRIVIAPMPSLPFPKSELGATLAAHICVSKFCDHLPLYRQRAQLKRAGLDVSDSTTLLRRSGYAKAQSAVGSKPPQHCWNPWAMR